MTCQKFLGYCFVSVLALAALTVPVGISWAAQPATAHKIAIKKDKKQKHIDKSLSKKSDKDETVLGEDLATIEKQDADTAPPLPLRRALVEAYTGNPQLEAARAQLRSVDETYAQAVSGFRPNVNGIANYQSVNDDGNLGHYRTDQKQLTLQVQQPIYSGGATVAQMDAAKRNIMAQRALLQAREQDVLLQTATAYVDVLRDKQVLDLNRYNEKVLSDRLKEARERYKLGDITRTDVSQAEARLAAATAERVSAQGDYRVSRARFEKVTGLEPEGLEQPGIKLSLPQTLDSAIAAAEANNPMMESAAYAREAAISNTRAAEGQLLPQVSLVATADKYYKPIYSPNDEQSGTSVMLEARVPLYMAGADYSRIRQSRQVEAQKAMDINSTRRDVRQSAVDAWEQLAAARAEKDARAAQVRAARLALKGVKVETDYGSRTTLDLLDAEREYRDAQVAYASAERNRIVASYGLLAAVGKLTVAGLGLDAAAYNPDKNFQKVKDKWFGTGIKGD
jgi:TolC family type I secretion outer membrane protein